MLTMRRSGTYIFQCIPRLVVACSGSVVASCMRSLVRVKEHIMLISILDHVNVVLNYII